jgi:hypothetical protein
MALQAAICCASAKSPRSRGGLSANDRFLDQLYAVSFEHFYLHCGYSLRHSEGRMFYAGKKLAEFEGGSADEVGRR